MDHAVPTRDTLHALELRVFEGPQGGARAVLAAGVACVLAAAPDGHDEGADIVLREEQIAPARVRITADLLSADLPQAQLEVLHGEVRLGDQVLSAGAQAPWAMHAPLQIGRSVVAFGRAGENDWSSPAAASGGAAAEGPRDDGAAAAATSAAAATAGRAPLRRRPEVWLATMGAAVLLICAAALWTAHLAAAPRAAQEPPSLAVALQSSEFAELHAAMHADGRVELRGRLGTLAERARLDTWLAERRFTPSVIDVQVDEALARDVTEVFRVNGVAVQAQVSGPRVVVAEAAERDGNRLARAEEVVRRDVRGLDKLTVRNTAVPLPPPSPPIVDDPGKRIASLVPALAPGQLSYIVTADGSRYFVGALLPTGHRITQIAKQRVSLERDGQQSTLNF